MTNNLRISIDLKFKEEKHFKNKCSKKVKGFKKS